MLKIKTKIKMSEHAPMTTPGEAQSKLDDAMKLAFGSPNVGDSPATMQEDGVRTTEHTFAQGAQTPDAEILASELNGHLAGTTEGDRTYVASMHSGEVSVVRPDGNGGEYRAKLTGINGEKAADIVAKRASRRVGSAVLKLDAGMRTRKRHEMR